MDSDVFILEINKVFDNFKMRSKSLSTHSDLVGIMDWGGVLFTPRVSRFGTSGAARYSDQGAYESNTYLNYMSSMRSVSYLVCR